MKYELMQKWLNNVNKVLTNTNINVALAMIVLCAMMMGDL